MTVVVSITSCDNGYPLHVELSDYEEFLGWACVEQLRAVDLNAWHAQHVGYLRDDDISELLNVVGAVFGI